MKSLLLIALLASAAVAQAYPRPTINDFPPQSLLEEKSREERLAEAQEAWDSSPYAIWANEKMMANGRKNVSHQYTCGYTYIAGQPTLETIQPVYGQTDIETLCEAIETWENSSAGILARAAHSKKALEAARAAGFDSRKNEVRFSTSDVYGSASDDGSKRAVAVKVTTGKALIDVSNLESLTVHQNLGTEKCVRNVNFSLSAGGYIRTTGGCKAIFKAIYGNQ